jgi:DNA-binding response OmpR family regulator
MRTVAATNATVLLLGETGIPSNEDQDRVNGYGLSANSYVRKPVDFAQFIEAIRQPGLYRSHSQLG